MLLTLHQLVQLVNEGTRAADTASTGAGRLMREHVLLTLQVSRVPLYRCRFLFYTGQSFSEAIVGEPSFVVLYSEGNKLPILARLASSSGLICWRRDTIATAHFITSTLNNKKQDSQSGACEKTRLKKISPDFGLLYKTTIVINSTICLN